MSRDYRKWAWTFMVCAIMLAVALTVEVVRRGAL